MRGLKRGNEYICCDTNKVASFTDAWIETRQNGIHVCIAESHLLQMRGLKQSRTFRMDTTDHVASFTDAWIETDHHHC